MQDESRWQNVLACAWTKGSAHGAGGRSVELGRVQVNREAGEAKWYCRPEKGRGGGIIWEKVEASCGKHRQELLWLFTAPSVNFQK